MLVLSRKQDRAIHIGSDIKVQVLSIKRQSVTLGIDAPDSVRILRDELVPPLDQQPPALNQCTAGMRIVLVVEDDPGHAKLIRKALCQHQGTMVTVAETAQIALDALDAQLTSPDAMIQPDLIMLDLGLPDGSGLDVLRRIRSVPELRSTPVVVLSCSDDEDVLNECMESGANAFVPKLAGYDDFRAQVSRVGQFWAGDCFARRSFNHRRDNIPSIASHDAETQVDGFEKPPAVADRAKRILLVDDDAGHATLIKRALRRAKIDCTVDVVCTGVEAIDYLFGQGDSADSQTTALPDLMLLDLNMPEMNGLQVLQVLQNSRNQGGQRLALPPVVVFTSSDADTDLNDSYRLGAQSFVRKPADHGRFAHAVQQTTQYWLGLNESQRDEPSRQMQVPR